MIVTEEEAKTKRCQESFGDGSVTPTGHMVAVHMTAGAGYAIGTSPSMCIGSACMAWRGIDPSVERTETGLGEMPKGEGWRQVDRRDPNTGVISYGLVWERLIHRGGGFCGKAGRP